MKTACNDRGQFALQSNLTLFARQFVCHLHTLSFQVYTLCHLHTLCQLLSRQEQTMVRSVSCVLVTGVCLDCLIDVCQHNCAFNGWSCVQKGSLDN